MAELTPHGAATLLFAVGVFVVFVLDRLPIATVCLGILAVLPLGYTLFPLQVDGAAVDAARFFAGLAHPALVAICALMVLGHGLVVTGALEPLARRLSAAVASRPRAALLAVLGVAIVASGVVNDTPVVVLMIPLLLAAARRAKTAAGQLLLPMNYAVLIGGMSTTIGTSTNLIVVALATSMGLQPLGLFDFYGIVMAAAVPAVLYLWLVAPRLLAHVQAPDEHLSDDAFDAELHVEAGSWLDGRQLREALHETGHRLQLLDIRRGQRPIARLPSLTLRAGDRLLVRDTAANLKDFESVLHARLHAVDESPESEGPAGERLQALPSAVVAQLIVTEGSALVGRTVRQERLAERYGFVVVGLRPRTSMAGWERSHLTDRQIVVGDILLVQGDAEAMRAAQADDVGLLLDERFTLPRQDKAPLALATMAVVVLLAGTKLLPIALAALLGVGLLLLTRCLSWQDATQALSVKVVLLVASSLALGDALQLSGATAWLAAQLATALQGWPTAMTVALLMALMGLMTNFVSNNAAAAIGTPLGIAMAQRLGIGAEPFVLAVLFGCNLCYLTPMGYQTNLLVMNAAGYRFGDFLRVGTPLFVILWAGLSALLAWRYGLL